MTEQEWLASTDQTAMLAYITADPFGPSNHVRPITDRQLRLFAVACCRSVWHLLVDYAPCGRCEGLGVNTVGIGIRPFSTECPDCSGTGRINRSRRAVEVAELFADGLATKEEAQLAANTATQINTHPIVSLNRVWRNNEFGNIPNSVQADLLRHIVGNPFRPMKTILDKTQSKAGHPLDIPSEAGAWLWHDERGTIEEIARTLYTGDQTAAGPLHDALEESGAPEELYEHFVEPCPYCKDAAFDVGDHGGPLASGRMTAKWLNSKCACKGTRLKYDTHPKGCRFLDAILNRQ